jgi:hypothetical protein
VHNTLSLPFVDGSNSDCHDSDGDHWVLATT